jgi:hypothetical protein
MAGLGTLMVGAKCLGLELRRTPLLLVPLFLVDFSICSDIAVCNTNKFIFMICHSNRLRIVRELAKISDSPPLACIILLTRNLACYLLITVARSRQVFRPISC